jgi:hypothetical protein
LDVDLADAIAVDASGNAYVTGSTSSTDFPVVNARQAANGGFYDAFVAKFDRTGRLVYSTYYGGAALDDGYGIAVDSAGSAYITGETTSSNLPMPAGDSPGGGFRFSRAFVAKFDPSGRALVYTSYFGGDDGDNSGLGIAVDPGGNAYITGSTSSRELNASGALRGPSDAFIAKFNPSATTFVALYHGGSRSDHGRGIVVDGWGNVYVTGVTDSTDLPTADPFQPQRHGGNDAFVTKFNHMLNAMVYSTYLGGNGYDYGEGIAVDAWGNAHVSGQTSSTDFPTANPLKASLSGARDAFVTVLNRTGAGLAFSTYYGGGGDDWARAIAVPFRVPDAYVTGATTSIDLPLMNHVQGIHAGRNDAFVAKISGVIDPDDVELTASPVTALPGGWISATWTHIPNATANDWIGLYDTWRAADDAFLARTSTYGQPSGGTSVQIPWETPFGAAYELRLFRNGARVATSNTFTVQPSTVQVHGDSVIAGREVTVSWAYVQSPAPTDWIGLYQSRLSGDQAYLTSQATTGRESGSIVLAIPSGAIAGTTYEVRLFNGGRRVATSESFTIRVTTLGVSTTRVQRGGAVTATWTDIARPTATDWIGLYYSSAASNTSYQAYRYTNGSTSGALVLTIPAIVPTGTTYELRLFSNNGYTRLATSASFRVEQATLRISPTTVPQNFPAVATWSGIPSPTVKDWIGLYASPSAPDSPSISWMYTPGIAGGSLPFTIPAGVAPGTTYELRLFSNNGYSRLATSNTFTIQPR